MLPAAALFVFSLTLFSPYWNSGLSSGISTVGALRVASGELPYRDFWTMYAPGSFWLLGGLFGIFGLHLLVETVAASLISAGAVSATYVLARQMRISRPLSVACGVILLAALIRTGYFATLGTYPPVLLCALVALGAFLRGLRGGGTRAFLLAGLATGAAAVFKHDVGAYVGIAIAAAIAGFAMTDEKHAGERTRTLMGMLGPYVLGVCILFLPAAALVLSYAGRDVVHDLIIFPLTDFRYARPENYPGIVPSWVYDPWKTKMVLNAARYVVFWLPLGLFALGVHSTIAAARRRDGVSLSLGVVLLTLLLFHFFAAHVQINTHIVSMSMYGALLGALPMIKSGGLGTLRRRLMLGGIAFVWLGSLVVEPTYNAWASRGIDRTRLRLPRVSGTWLPTDRAQHLVELVSLVDSLTVPGDKIYVGLHRHDAVVIGDAMLYFVLGHPSATRYHEVHPAVTDTRPVQREIIGDLDRFRVPVVILKHIFPDDVLDDVKSGFRRHLPQVGAPDLDRYIQEKYELVERLGPYAVWERKGSHEGPA